MSAAGQSRSATCSLCGAVESPPPVTWMQEYDRRRGQMWVCDRCARQNLRAIEAKLDREWW
ncbi:MAG TPA: hypothetical protein VFC16_08330 [Nakamurella sp.]|jgi:hypothetical protein|nr:hypothetical protein [Nakamurella sp.]